MNRCLGILTLFAGMALSRCAPIETISSHNFASGYYRLESRDEEPARIYAHLNGDSLTVYRMKAGSNREPDPATGKLYKLNDPGQDNYFYSHKLVRNSIDADLSTIVTKIRPAQAGVPPQMNSNFNAALYIGGRKDFFSFKQHKEVLRSIPYIRQTGFDAGLFAGFGITFMSPTNTEGRTGQEYDGIVFQKGAAVFFTFDRISVGLACGFDNLIGADSKIWIYNNKPWFGLALGIANF